jgi:hypothetical protein
MVYHFAVSCKPAVANGMEKAFFCTLVINPCRQSVKDKNVMLLYAVDYTALDICVALIKANRGVKSITIVQESVMMFCLPPSAVVTKPLHALQPLYFQFQTLKSGEVHKRGLR